MYILGIISFVIVDFLFLVHICNTIIGKSKKGRAAAGILALTRFLDVMFFALYLFTNISGLYVLAWLAFLSFATYVLLQFVYIVISNTVKERILNLLAACVLSSTLVFFIQYLFGR